MQIHGLSTEGPGAPISPPGLRPPVEKTKKDELNQPSAATRADTIELSASATKSAGYAPSSRLAASRPSPVDAQPAPTNAQQPAAAAQQQTFTQAHLDGLLAAFGSRTGDAGFNPAFDHNADGVIDFSDLNTVLSNFEPPAAAPAPTPPSQPPASTPDGSPSFGPGDLAGLVQAYGRRVGEQGFDPRFDINADGVIDFSDLNAALSSFEPPVPSHQQERLGGLLNAFGSSQGDPTFDPRFDINGDGRITFADLNSLLDDLFNNG